MALEYKLTGDILHVKESLHYATHTKVTHWYHDIKKWLVSSYGREGDVPDRAMVPAAIEWVKKYHLPKVGL